MSNFAHANKGTTYTVNHYLATKHIGIWCNGNTTDSGPVILGSSPSIPTADIQSEASVFLFNLIGIWCNGNTTDSGPVILGSSPSIPTEKAYSLRIGFFRIWKILLNLMAAHIILWII